MESYIVNRNVSAHGGAAWATIVDGRAVCMDYLSWHELNEPKLPRWVIKGFRLYPSRLLNVARGSQDPRPHSWVQSITGRADTKAAADEAMRHVDEYTTALQRATSDGSVIFGFHIGMEFYPMSELH